MSACRPAAQQGLWTHLFLITAALRPEGGSAAGGGWGLDWLPPGVQFVPHGGSQVGARGHRDPPPTFEIVELTGTTVTTTTTTTPEHDCEGGSPSWHQWSSAKRAACCPRVQGGCRDEESSTTTTEPSGSSAQRVRLALLVQGLDTSMLGKPQEVFLEAALAARIATAGGVDAREVRDLRGEPESVSMDEGTYATRKTWWLRPHLCQDAVESHPFTLVSSEILTSRGVASNIGQLLDSADFERSVAELIDANLHDDSLAKQGPVAVCGSTIAFDPPLPTTATSRTTITGTSITTTETATVVSVTSTTSTTTTTTTTTAPATSTSTTTSSKAFALAVFRPKTVGEKIGVNAMFVGLAVAVVAFCALLAAAGACQRCQRSSREVSLAGDEEAPLKAAEHGHGSEHGGVEVDVGVEASEHGRGPEHDGVEVDVRVEAADRGHGPEHEGVEVDVRVEAAEHGHGSERDGVEVDVRVEADEPGHGPEHEGAEVDVRVEVHEHR